MLTQSPERGREREREEPDEEDRLATPSNKVYPVLIPHQTKI